MTTKTLTELRELIASARYTWNTEADLQRGVAQILTSGGVAFAEQVRLGLGDRLDFLVDGCTAVELKIKGSASDVLRQLMRYARRDEITGLLLVTTRHLHQVPAALNGKPTMRAVLVGSML